MNLSFPQTTLYVSHYTYDSQNTHQITLYVVQVVYKAKDIRKKKYFSRFCYLEPCHSKNMKSKTKQINFPLVSFSHYSYGQHHEWTSFIFFHSSLKPKIAGLITDRCIGTSHVTEKTNEIVSCLSTPRCLKEKKSPFFDITVVGLIKNLQFYFS